MHKYVVLQTNDTCLYLSYTVHCNREVPKVSHITVAQLAQQIVATSAGVDNKVLYSLAIVASFI